MYRLGLLVLVLSVSLGVLGQETKTSQYANAKGIVGVLGVEVLSDVSNVDFGPYMSKAASIVRANWWVMMPEEAKPPRRASGETVVQFAILPEGKIDSVTLLKSSGSNILDRAVIAALVSSNPLPRLPAKFKGPLLSLRFTFQYNPK
jgi:TonB family protein